MKTEKNLESSPFWNPESTEAGIRNLVLGIRNPESTGWNPESKTVMDSLTWGENFTGTSTNTVLKYFKNGKGLKTISTYSL